MRFFCSFRLLRNEFISNPISDRSSLFAAQYTSGVVPHVHRICPRFVVHEASRLLCAYLISDPLHKRFLLSFQPAFNVVCFPTSDSVLPTRMVRKCDSKQERFHLDFKTSSPLAAVNSSLENTLSLSRRLITLQSSFYLGAETTRQNCPIFPIVIRQPNAILLRKRKPPGLIEPTVS